MRLAPAFEQRLERSGERPSDTLGRVFQTREHDPSSGDVDAAPLVESIEATLDAQDRLRRAVERDQRDAAMAALDQVVER